MSGRRRSQLPSGHGGGSRVTPGIDQEALHIDKEIRPICPNRRINRDCRGGGDRRQDGRVQKSISRPPERWVIQATERRKRVRGSARAGSAGSDIAQCRQIKRVNLITEIVTMPTAPNDQPVSLRVYDGGTPGVVYIGARRSETVVAPGSALARRSTPLIGRAYGLQKSVCAKVGPAGNLRCGRKAGGEK